MDGYFVDSDLSPLTTPLSSLIAWPLPLTAQAAKSTELPSVSGSNSWWEQTPWWAQPGSRRRAWLSDPSQERDQLQKGDQTETVKFKRIKSDDVLVSKDSGQTLFRTRPKTQVLLRNRSPVRRLGRTQDSRRENAENLDKEKGDLFATTVLSEGQRFVADITFGSPELAKQFIEQSKSLLTKSAGSELEKEASASWLRVGRGGRPVLVERYEWLNEDTAPTLKADATEFTLTLTSDLIGRRADLTFLTTLDAEALQSLTGISGLVGQIEVSQQESVSETRIVRGFNTAAGTFRSPAVAIKRGSAFLVKAAVADSNAATLRSLFERLAALSVTGLGLGERPEDGFGRFVLNSRAHQPRTPSPYATEQRSRPAQSVREHAIERVLSAVAEMRLAEAVSRDKFPARSQWQWLRHEAEVVGKLPTTIMAEIEEAAKKLSGANWKTNVSGGELATRLTKLTKEAGNAESQRLFLIYLCRWVVVQLDQHRRKATAGEVSD